MTTRRDFISTLSIGAAGLALGGCRRGTSLAGAPLPSTVGATGWDMVPGILKRIVPPTFPDRDFSIERYGAKGDGRTDCTVAIRDAIAACAAAGGGRVVVPAGRFLTGAVHLKSNVNLHVVFGAYLLFSRDPRAYLPTVLTRFEGTELMNYSPFIYAFDQQNIAVTGKGTLDGQANEEFWWPWKGNRDFGWKVGAPNYTPARNRLLAMAEQGTPVSARQFGEGDYLRPSFIEPYRCTNVLIEDVRIIGSPMWEIHPVLCQNITVRGVTIDTHGPNNDGCDPESCRDVLIERTVFNTGDDCIAIKSGRNADGRRVHVPSTHIIVRNCEMRDGHGGVTVGSEISGDCRHVFAHDCKMDSPRLDRALRLKNNAMRGGVLEHIYMKDVTVGQVADSVLSVDFTYEEGANGPFRPVVRDVELRNVTSRKSPYGVVLKSYANAELSDIRILNCSFAGVEKGNIIESTSNVRWDGTTINGRSVG